MKQFLYFLKIFFSLQISLYSQKNIPTLNLLPNRTILESTFEIFYNSKSGSSFIVNGEKGQYLITAKHLFGPLIHNNTDVEIDVKAGGSVNKKIKAKVYFHDNPKIDIAVLKLDTILNKDVVLPLSHYDNNSTYYLGQQCLFLGYPIFNLGTVTDFGKFAFVKSAIISAFYKEDNIEIMLLDGQNNPGFSGGPIITYIQTMDELYVIGMVSGYINQPQDVDLKLNNERKIIQINENSGIIIAYSSNYISEIIKRIELK